MHAGKSHARPANGSRTSNPSERTHRATQHRTVQRALHERGPLLDGGDHPRAKPEGASARTPSKNPTYRYTPLCAPGPSLPPRGSPRADARRNPDHAGQPPTPLRGENPGGGAPGTSSDPVPSTTSDRRTEPRHPPAGPPAPSPSTPDASGTPTASRRNAARTTSARTSSSESPSSRARSGLPAPRRRLPPYGRLHTVRPDPSEAEPAPRRRHARPARPSPTPGGPFRSTPRAPLAASPATAGSGCSSVTHSCTLPRGSSFTLHVTGSRRSVARSRTASSRALNRTSASTTLGTTELRRSRRRRLPERHCATWLPPQLPVSPQKSASPSRRRRHSRRRPRRSSRRPPKHQRGRPASSFANRAMAASAFRRATAFRRRLTGWSFSSGQRSRRSSSRCANVRSRSRPPSLHDLTL